MDATYERLKGIKEEGKGYWKRNTKKDQEMKRYKE